MKSAFRRLIWQLRAGQPGEGSEVNGAEQPEATAITQAGAESGQDASASPAQSRFWQHQLCDSGSAVEGRAR